MQKGENPKEHLQLVNHLIFTKQMSQQSSLLIYKVLGLLRELKGVASIYITWKNLTVNVNAAYSASYGNL